MYVRVEVYAGTKKEKISIIGENRLEIKVKELAERNLANHRVREIVAEHYGVLVTEAKIVAGHHSQRKIISIEGN